jgi:hypothetical protein
VTGGGGRKKRKGANTALLLLHFWEPAASTNLLSLCYVHVWILLLRFIPSVFTTCTSHNSVNILQNPNGHDFVAAQNLPLLVSRFSFEMTLAISSRTYDFPS